MELLEHNAELCLMNNVAHFLSSHGLAVTNEQLCLISGCYGFLYQPDALRYERLSGLNGDFAELFEHIQDSIFCKWIKVELFDPETYLAQIDEITRDYGPVIVWINDYVVEESVHYQIDCFYRPIVVIGVEYMLVRVFDNGFLTMPARQFFDSTIHRNDQTFGYQMVNETQLQWVLPPNEQYDCGFRRMIDKFHSSGSMMLSDYRQSLVHETTSEVLFEYYYSIKMAGGLVPTRMQLADIERLGTLSGEITEVFNYKEQQLSYQWKMIANLLFRLSENYSKDLRDRILRRLDDAILLEHEAIEILSKGLIIP